MSWSTRLHSAIEQRQREHLWRTRAHVASPQGAVITLNGKRVLNFCSNDYLGLAALGGDDLARSARTWQLGSGASHLVCGHSQAHHELERALAQHTGYEAALLFSTGYMANVGVQQALLARGDTALHDKLNHASLLDGAELSGAKRLRYHHNDALHLQQRLGALDGSGLALVATDSIFSMDGDLADLPTIARVCQQHDALLMVDDAHGFGVLGEQGQGARAHFGLNTQDMPLMVGTLGKALGGFGAFVAASQTMIDYLIQFARPYIYTTALPPALADAMLANLERLKQPERHQALERNINHFIQRAQTLALPLMPSQSPIQPLLVHDSAKALNISQALLNKGLWVSAIRPPTVPPNQARLRITLSAAHSLEQIDQLLQALAELFDDQPA